MSMNSIPSSVLETQPMSQFPGYDKVIKNSKAKVDILLPGRSDMIHNLLGYDLADSLVVESLPNIRIRVIQKEVSSESTWFMVVRIQDNNKSFTATIKFADILENGSVPVYKKEDNSLYGYIHIAPKWYNLNHKKSLYF